MVVPGGRCLRTRLRNSVYRHHWVVRARGSSTEWCRGTAHVSGWENDGMVGYPCSLCSNGLSLRTCRVIALPRVETDQQKRDAPSNRVCGFVRCVGLGCYLDELCLAHHSQRYLRRGHERRPEGDRKSTRLNSSHLVISYAVFCL